MYTGIEVQQILLNMWVCRVKIQYSDTSANEDNSFRNHIL